MYRAQDNPHGGLARPLPIQQDFFVFAKSSSLYPQLRRNGCKPNRIVKTSKGTPSHDRPEDALSNV